MALLPAELKQNFKKITVWPTLYLFIIVVIHATFVVVAFRIGSDNRSIIALLWLVYTLIVGFPVAEKLSQFIVFLAARRPDVPARLKELSTHPRVALLYCTCDDAVADCLYLLGTQTYPDVRVFLLDDSQTDYNQQLIVSTGFEVVRRYSRKGYKAGNINHWLSKWGKEFDYFVILDADSILPPTFVEEILLYAEHPDNSQIAFFESRILCWRPTNAFQRALATQLAVANETALRLMNRLGTTLSNGHNNLCRCSHLLSIGGFDERFISEDHATTLNLLQNNLSCRIVDIKSYEIPPVNLRALKRRTRRWVRNDIQLLKHPWTNVPLTLQLRIVLLVVLHFLWLATAVTMPTIMWAYQTSLGDIFLFSDYVLRYQGYLHPRISSAFMLFFIYLVYLFVSPLPPVFAARLNFLQYAHSTFIYFCLGFGNMFAAIQGLTAAILRNEFQFEVTPKHSESISLSRFISDNWSLCLMSLVILLGVIRNPASLLFNWTWIIPLLSSPIVLYVSQLPDNNHQYEELEYQ